MRTSDQFVILSSARRSFALAVDAMLGVVECPDGGVVPAWEILPEMARVEGVMILADGMILISDIGKILSLGDEAALGDQLDRFGGLGAEAGEELHELANEL